MKRIQPFRNRRDVLYLVHEEPTKESENGIYIVKPKDNSYRAIWAVVWGIPLKLISTLDGYTTEQVDKLILDLKTNLESVDSSLKKINTNLTSKIESLEENKADKDVIEAISNDIIRKEAVNTFKELKTTYPNPKKGWDVLVLNDENYEDKRASRYNWNGEQWIDLHLSIYESNVATLEHINDIREKTNPINMGANMFSGLYQHFAILTDNSISTGTHLISAVCKLKDNDKYVYIYSDNKHNRNRIAFVSEKPTEENAHILEVIGETKVFNNGEKISVPSRAVYLIVYVSNTSQEPLLQVTNTATPFFIGYDRSIRLNLDNRDIVNHFFNTNKVLNIDDQPLFSIDTLSKTVIPNIISKIAYGDSYITISNSNPINYSSEAKFVYIYIDSITFKLGLKSVNAKWGDSSMNTEFNLSKYIVIAVYDVSNNKCYSPYIYKLDGHIISDNQSNDKEYKGQIYNLFDGSYKNLGLLTDGTISTNSSILKSIVLSIDELKTDNIIVELFSEDINRFRIAYTKEYPTSNSSTFEFVDGKVENKNIKIERNKDYKYLIITVTNLGSEPLIQITDSFPLLSFVGYKPNPYMEINSRLQQLNKTSYIYGNYPLLKINSTEKTISFRHRSAVFINGRKDYILTDDKELLYKDPSNPFMLIIFNLKTKDIELKPISQWTVNSKNPPIEYLYIGIINPITNKVFGIDEDMIELDGNPLKGEAEDKRLDEYIDAHKQLVDYAPTPKFNQELGIFKAPEELPNLEGESEGSLKKMKSIEIYDRWAKLEENNPNLISSEIIGESVLKTPIKAIHIGIGWNIKSNEKYGSGRKSILINCSIHGYEKIPAIATLELFEFLFKNKDSKWYNHLLMDVDYYIIPVANPDGFDAHRRTNENGIDINRNFNYKWIKTSSSSDYYSGEQPNSEPETNALSSYLDKISNELSYVIDYHNIAGGDPLFYVLHKAETKYANTLFVNLSRMWADKYSLEGAEKRPYGYINISSGKGMFSGYAQNKNIRGITLETPWRQPFAKAMYDKVTLETAIETLANQLSLLSNNI